MVDSTQIMLPELSAILDLLEGGFGRLKILVVGDLMLERYISGEVDRISPEAPVPVLRHARRHERAGGAANVAMNLAGLGCQAYLAGFWGDDAEKTELAAILEDRGVDTVGVVSGSLPTISRTRIVGRVQQLLRLDIESEDDRPTVEEARLIERVTELAGKMSAVILSDYAKGALTRPLCEAVIRAAKAAGVPVFVDPKTPDFSKYSGATTVCPNLRELSLATGVAAHKTDELVAAARDLLARLELQFLAVTMSEMGITVVEPDATYHSPAREQEVFDVSGAGDTVIATLAAGVAGGLRVRTAIDLANLAAGIAVAKVGTVPVAKHELIAALTPSSGIAAAEKVIDRDRATKRVAEWRAAGDTIVFTDGSFDILQVSHIRMLEECRKFGSKLVLGLNSDASVARLKGPSRPIVGERERATVMSALAAVDAVVLFDEDTPLELIQSLKPNVLVKGGDYTVETVVGHAEVIAAGGRVEIVPLLEGLSTMDLVKNVSEGTHPGTCALAEVRG